MWGCLSVCMSGRVPPGRVSMYCEDHCVSGRVSRVGVCLGDFVRSFSGWGPWRCHGLPVCFRRSRRLAVYLTTRAAPPLPSPRPLSLSWGLCWGCTSPSVSGRLASLRAGCVRHTSCPAPAATAVPLCVILEPLAVWGSCLADQQPRLPPILCLSLS